MKKFRFLKIAMAVAILAGFSSCNDDVNVDSNNPIDGEAAKSYVSVSINIPIENGMKGAEDSSVDEQGLPAESDIKNVTFYFFEESTNTPFLAAGTYDYLGLYRGTLTMSAADFSVSGTTHSSATPKAVSGLEIGKSYNVYAVVNGTTNISLTAGTTTEATFLETSRVTETTIANVSTTGFPMANRQKALKDDAGNGNIVPFSRLTISTGNNATNADAVTLFQMERIMGKLIFTGNDIGNGDNVYILKDGALANYATVEIKRVKAINMLKDGYLFRHMTRIPAAEANDFFKPATDFNGFELLGDATYDANGDVDSDADYIIDPRTKSKTNSTPLATGYEGWYSAGAFTGAPADGIQSIIYCLENTMHSGSQLNGYTTALLFEAEVVPENIVMESATPGTNDAAVAYVTGTHPATFYMIGNMAYGSISALVNAGVNLAPTTIDGTATAVVIARDLKNNNVTRCDNGLCYYKYWIKHEPHTERMAVMEYGIVRNNVYKMKVATISGIGESIEEIIDPEEENEQSNVFISVQLEILPWIVRTQEDIVL